MISSSRVRLVFFEQSIGCETCGAARRALEQLAASDERVSLDVFNLVLDREKAAELGVDRVPATIVAADGRDRIRYYGAPLGRELSTLVDAIGMTSSGETGLSDQTVARLKALTKPARIQVFFTPTCVYCPQMIALANRLAVESPLVSAVAIDATEYPDLVRRYRVNGVPKTVINETVEITGVASEEDVVNALCGS